MAFSIAYFFLIFEVVLVFFYPIGCLFPSIFHIFVFVIFFCCASTKKGFLIEVLKHNSLGIAIFLVVITRCLLANRIYLNDFYSPIHAAISQFNILSCSIYFEFLNKINQKRKDLVFKIAIISICITILFSVYYILFSDSNAVRNSKVDEYWGVADFNFVYMISIFSGPIFFIALKASKRSDKVLCFGLTTLFFFFLLFCNLVTSLVIFGLSVFLAVMLYFRSKVLIFFVCICGGIFVNFRKQIASFLSAIIKILPVTSSYTLTKLNVIVNIISGENGNLDTLSTRGVLSSYGINTLKENPLFGIDFKYHTLGTIGGHSQWTDDLARYGILGIVIIFVNYFFIIKHVIFSSRNNPLTRPCILGSIFSLFILGFLNPCLCNTILMLILVIIPSISIRE